jgi:adenosylcobinamide-GDP ribazoletransferase
VSILRRLAAAIAFLTVMPLPARWRGGPSELGRSVAFFPVVGGMLGALALLADEVLIRHLPRGVASVILVIVLLAASGGLHIDGLADTADGFMSSKPRARILEIMKDGRSGPMGVAAVVCVVALKIASLSAFEPSVLRRVAIALMPLSGRSAIVIAMTLLPYARSEGGTGSAFAEHRPWVGLVLAASAPAAIGWWWVGVAGLAPAVASGVMALAMCLWSYRTIRGWTGDTLGATCEIAEAFSLVALLASTRVGRG